MKKAPTLTVLLFIATCFVMVSPCQADVTWEGLIDQMLNLEALAKVPEPSFTCKQFSSYDRRAKSPDENWFANSDRGFHLRTEEKDGRKEHVMVDAKGPGAVVRIWSANPMGNLRFYVDGGKKPDWTVSMKDLLHGNVPPLKKPICGMRSRGCNLYFPIPYAEHMKVTCDKRNFYYQVNYRTYKAGTKIESFSLEKLHQLKDKITRIADRLQERKPHMPPTSAMHKEEFALELKPGGTVEGTQGPWGPAAIRLISLHVAAQDLTEALRGVIVKTFFDAEKDPSICCPLGDFFGSAPGLNPYRSLPLEMHEGGKLVSRWVMPYQRNVWFELENLSGQNVTLSGFMLISDWDWTGRSMHFHAKWRSQHDIPTRPFKDWTYLKTSGKGSFVGDMLVVRNPVKAWWGEGDEKIYVDGESFPSHFGTGTEDYYGYAWCNPAPFEHAYHNQTRCDGPGNYGWTSLNRFHVLDRIPYREKFRFDMEVWHWKEVEMDYAAASFWYERPGGEDFFSEPTKEDIAMEPVPPFAGAAKVKGAIEGENMKVLEKTGNVRRQDLTSFGRGWSLGAHLWWTDGEVGDEVKLAFEAEGAGKHRVIANMTKAVDYGIVQILLNGKEIGPKLDLYNDGVIPYKVDLGVHKIKKGTNTLTLRLAGTNPKAVKKYMAGLDYIMLK